MIIVGKGTDLKQIGFAGIEKCPNCKNYAPFWLCEHSSKVTAYFITVARYSRQLLYLCERCDQAFTMQKGTEDAAIKKTVAMPTREDAVAIWNTIHEGFVEVLGRGKGQDEATLSSLVTEATQMTISELKRSFQPQHVDYVHSQYIQYLGDEDKPR